MAANPQRGYALRQLHSLVEGRTVRHQGGGGDDAARVSLNDRSIHAGGETKIVGIDDQPPHAASLAGQITAAAVQCAPERKARGSNRTALSGTFP